jgi:small-conductance mechanosensitive channel/CRP-like cAMP-binding protein
MNGKGRRPKHSIALSCHLSPEPITINSMDLSFVFAITIVTDAALLKLIPERRRVARFACMSIFFAVETVLIVALVGSPLHPVFRLKELPREFWLQILTCCWWVLAARELISFLAIATALRRTKIENKLLSDIVAASIYVCSALAMMGFVFGLSLQGLLATSGIIAIVLGLALQSTLGDVFSGISLSIEKPYRIGDEIVLEGGAEGKVIQMNWRSTHLENGANDVVIVPNSAIAKMRIQNHSAGPRCYSGSLTVIVDSRNEPELTLEILKQAAMTCPCILENPAPSAAATEFRGDRITYAIFFSTLSVASQGDARSQLITQLYKRARPVVGVHTPTTGEAVIFFPENELCDHLPLLEPLNDAERAHLSQTIIRRHFQVGEQILEQGITVGSAYFISFGVIQGTRQVQDGRVLKLERMGPGDSFGETSLLAGIPSIGTLTALTPGLLLQVDSENLKPLLESRPELVDSLSYAAAQLKQSITALEREAMQPIMIRHLDISSRIKKFLHLSVAGVPLNSKTEPHQA